MTERLQGMQIPGMLLASLIGLFCGWISPPEPQARVTAVLAEFDREAAKPLWPGFEPASIPLEIFDGGRTWLARHPRPPAEFVPVPGAGSLRVFEGRHATMRANTAVEIDGVLTATASALREQFFVIESASPLFPQGFDPLNVERLSSISILHTRFVKLGNAEGAVEILDKRCLTEAAGKHPLFGGVRRATVAGFPGEPPVDASGGTVRIAVPGVTLAFRNATVSRSGNTVTVFVEAASSAAPR